MNQSGPRVDPRHVASFEAQLGTTIPEDYARFLLEINGGHTSPASRVFDIHTNGRDNSTILNNLYSLAEPDEQFDLETAWRASRRWLPSEMMPIGYDDGGGQIVLAIDGAHRGEIWFLDGVERRPADANPRVAWFERRDVCRLAPSFEAFIAMLRPLQAAKP